MFVAKDYLETLFSQVIRNKDDLHDYQQYAVEWLKEHSYSALFIDVGMGKTVIILSLIDWAIMRGYTKRILVIAPIKVINRVWAYEYKLWAHTVHMRVHNLRVEDDDPRLAGLKGQEKTVEKNRLKVEALDHPAQIHLINQEAIPWLVQQFVERRGKKFIAFRRWQYPFVVFDESSRLRDHSSETSKWLRRIRDKIARFHELTATPASQTYMHLFSQIYLLDQGQRLGRNITPFRKQYFNYDPYKSKWEIRPDADKQIEEKIADICLVMRNDRSDDEKPIINEWPVRLPRDVMKKYRDFQRDYVLETDVGEIEAVHGGALSMKLLQLASGVVYDADRRTHWFHDEKIEGLKEIQEEALGQPILVGYWFKPTLVRLKQAFPKAVVMDTQGKAEADWNKGNIQMMFVHPQSAAHGLNLQFGGHHLAIFDLFWSLELFLQLLGRLDRQGQISRVIVHLLTAKGTEDQIVADNLRVLEDAQDAFFNRLRALHARITGK